MAVDQQAGQLRSGVRRICCLLAALATLPYLTLKAAWLLGSDLGVRDPELMATTTYRVANAVTLLMDAAVVILALLLASPPRRLSSGRAALFVVAPMWCATGLLLMPVLGSVVLLATGAGRDTGSGAAGDDLESWVYAVVYTGFGLQGALLVVAFVLYAVARWPQLRSRAAGSGPPADRSLLGPGLLAGVLAAAAGVACWWAGLDASTRADMVTWSVSGYVCSATAIGAVWLAGRASGEGSVLPPLALVWLGSGAMTLWSLFSRAVVVPARGDHGASALRAWELQLVLGLAVAALVAVMLRRSGRWPATREDEREMTETTR